MTTRHLLATQPAFTSGKFPRTICPSGNVPDNSSLKGQMSRLPELRVSGDPQNYADKAAFNFGMNGINRRAFISLDALSNQPLKSSAFTSRPITSSRWVRSPEFAQCQGFLIRAMDKRHRPTTIAVVAQMERFFCLITCWSARQPAAAEQVTG